MSGRSCENKKPEGFLALRVQEDLVIYEMHVRGFSHTSPTAEAPGTCASHSPPHAALKLAGRGRAGARVQHLGGLHRTTVRKGVKGVPESQSNRKVVVVKALEVH